MATGFWNLFGAGVLGFLINLPFVSYFQHGSFLTAAHAHGALMGVYGMLAIALALFSLRNVVDARYWKEKWLMTGFWGLNIGLMGMIVVTLVADWSHAGDRELPARLLERAVPGVLPAAHCADPAVASRRAG